MKVAPAVVAIIGTTDRQGTIDAGRLLGRVWSHLNSRGIAVHPYYVVADQLARLREGTVPAKLVPQAERIRNESARLFGLGPDETLHMLLRIGYPTREAPSSRRLPLEQVFTDLTVTGKSETDS